MVQIQQSNQGTVEEAMFYTICPQVLTTKHYKDLPTLCPPKAHKLESNVWSKRPPENSAKHDNKDNLYAADTPTVQPLDFTVLSEAEAVPGPHEKTTETSYKKKSQIVCVKADSSDTIQLFIMASLQENVSVGMKRVRAKVVIQDPFNPVLFTEDAEKYVDVSNIVSALTSYNYYNKISTMNRKIKQADKYGEQR